LKIKVTCTLEKRLDYFFVGMVYLRPLYIHSIDKVVTRTSEGGDLKTGQRLRYRITERMVYVL